MNVLEKKIDEWIIFHQSANRISKKIIWKDNWGVSSDLNKNKVANRLKSLFIQLVIRMDSPTDKEATISINISCWEWKRPRNDMWNETSKWYVANPTPKHHRANQKLRTTHPKLKSNFKKMQAKHSSSRRSYQNSSFGIPL